MAVWFITGSSTDFGRVLAEEALAAGHSVVATARRPESVADLVAAHPDRVLAVALDVTDAAAVEAAVAAGVARFGRLDVVVNNAGFGYGGALEEFSDEEIHAQYDTNVFGPLRVIRAVLPTLKGQGSGHVLNVTSVGGFRSRPGFALYASTKFALEAIGEGLVYEVEPFGIRVTNVEPGAFRTDFAGRSFRRAERTIEGYEETAHANLAWLDGIHGEQAGDPAKAARAMIAVTEEEEPPLWLPLGSDAVEGIRDKIARVAEAVDRAEPVARATAFDPA